MPPRPISRTNWYWPIASISRKCYHGPAEKQPGPCSYTEGMSPNQLFINGKWEDSACDRVLDVINPATGELVTTVPDADASDVDRAVASARASFEKKTWRGMDPSKRERILWNI